MINQSHVLVLSRNTGAKALAFFLAQIVLIAGLSTSPFAMKAGRENGKSNVKSKPVVTKHNGLRTLKANVPGKEGSDKKSALRRTAETMKHAGEIAVGSRKVIVNVAIVVALVGTVSFFAPKAYKAYTFSKVVVEAPGKAIETVGNGVDASVEAITDSIEGAKKTADTAVNTVSRKAEELKQSATDTATAAGDAIITKKEEGIDAAKRATEKTGTLKDQGIEKSKELWDNLFGGEDNTSQLDEVHP